MWRAVLALAIVAAPNGPAAYARARHSDAWAREHFISAERMREALNGRPSAERTRRDYQRVLNAYRTIYMGAPASSKADPSVVAVAETLVEMGRRFDDDKVLHAAIEQYKFLRREYPGSKFRFDGLFTVGEIYKDDLNDPEAARNAFQEFLRRYPHNRLADGARQAIAELNQPGKTEKLAKGPKAGEKSHDGKDLNESAESKNVPETEETPDSVVRAGKATRSDSENEQTAQQHGRKLARVTGIRHWSTPDYTRIAIDVESDVKFVSRRIDSPSRILFDLRNTKLASTLVGKDFDGEDGFLKKIRVAESAPGQTRVVLEIDNLSDYDAFLLPNPYRLVIDIHGKDWRSRKGAAPSSPSTVDAVGSTLSQTLSADADPKASDEKPVVLAKTDTTEAVAMKPSGLPEANKNSGVLKKIVEADDDSGKPSRPSGKKSRPASGGHTVAVKKPVDSDFETADLGTREARPTASGDRSLIRALGLKIGKIVIDAGHGGHDTGTIGPNGLEEKDLVLEVARRLGKMLETRLGAEVVYTRKDDTFIPLETRTAIANKARADLFVSIHANSSHDPDARGVETYYLNFTSSPAALEVAARENAVSAKSIYELQDLVKKIALKEKIEESREFAGDVQQSLHSGLAVKSPAIRDRGVKKAPFIVLIGANMPSILAEISFVSNPTDERRLEIAEYRQRIAESLYRGIAKYVNGLSGVKVASKMDKAAGQ
jgi:N-acetylmuramoyl-L-alanine amidase